MVDGAVSVERKVRNAGFSCKEPVCTDSNSFSRILACKNLSTCILKKLKYVRT